MKLRLLCVGRLADGWQRSGVADYSGRIGRYLPFETLELKEEKGAPGTGDVERIRSREGERLLEKISGNAFVVVLDERGVSRTSEQLAGLLEEHMLRGTGEVLLVIGGAYGLSEAVRRRAQLLLSLSALTLPHQLARLLLCEQLYRALTIIRHEPYHNR